MPRPFHSGPPNRGAALPPPLMAAALDRPAAGAVLPMDVGHYVATHGHRWARDGRQDHLLLILVTGGRGWWRLGGRSGSAGPGDLVVLPAGLAHAYGAEDLDPWIIWWAHWRGRELGTLAVDHPALAAGVHHLGAEAGGAQVAGAWDALLTAVATAQDGTGVLRAACAGWHLLGQLATARREARERADPRVLAILAAINAHPERTLSLTAAGRLAGCTPGHAQTLFRSAIGAPIGDYQQRLRLRRATVLLETTLLPVAEVARQVGYEDPFLFSRRFRGAYGCPPSEWRQRRPV